MTDVDSRLRLGQIVRILRGREAGAYAIVIGLKEPHFVWLADGNQHKFDRPKKKNVKHIQLTHTVAEEIANVLQEFGHVNNTKLRYALNQYLLLKKQSEKKGE